MSFNGSGTFQINTAGQPVVSGTVISSSAFNALTADLATGLSTCITKDGQTTITANIPMGSNKITGLAAGTTATDAANLSQVQGTTVKLISPVSGVDTITGSLTPALTAYAGGQMFYFVAVGNNTGPVTLNIDSLGAKAVTRDGSVALASGDIKSGEVVVVVYDGTRFQVVSHYTSSGTGTVTSVGQTFTGGLISVAGSPITTSGTLALTVAGTSGGVPYFSSGTTWASSGALAANALVVGGGAGAAPSTVTTGANVLTALGVAVGSSGAFTTNNAANTYTAAQTFRAANAVRSEAASTQDAVVLAGRAGGTGSFAVTLTPATLSASTTLTLPNVTDTLATVGTAQTFTAAQTFRAANAVRSEAASTQDAMVLAGRAGGTSSYALTLTPATLSASRTVTFPDESFTVGFRNIPAVGTKTGSYTLQTSDVGKYVQVGAGGSITIPNATFAEGDIVSIFNNTSGNVTITCTITTAYIGGIDSDKATVTLSTRGVATIFFIDGSTCVINGNVS